jgi:ribose/xylose/arabinose/galactoside ABC-type transport system permease subunit
LLGFSGGLIAVDLVEQAAAAKGTKMADNEVVVFIVFGFMCAVAGAVFMFWVLTLMASVAPPATSEFSELDETDGARKPK